MADPCLTYKISFLCQIDETQTHMSKWKIIKCILLHFLKYLSLESKIEFFFHCKNLVINIGQQLWRKNFDGWKFWDFWNFISKIGTLGSNYLIYPRDFVFHPTASKMKFHILIRSMQTTLHFIANFSWRTDFFDFIQ